MKRSDKNPLLKKQLEDTQKKLDEANNEIKALRIKNAELESKLAKTNDTLPPKEDPKKTKPKDTNPKPDTPKNDTPSSLEEENANGQLDKARKLVDSDKETATKLLKKLIDEHPKTQAAKEAQKLLDGLK